MNIALVIDSQLPALLYGGTERVVWGLMRALKARGHKLWLLAPKGTACPFAEVIVRDEQLPIETQVPKEVDLVHFHVPIARPYPQPHVITVHGNSLATVVSNNYIFVSKQHATRFGVDSYVWNGLNWDDYPTPSLTQPRSHYHFLGKAAWRLKNLKGAIDTVHAIPNGHLDVLGGHRLNLKMGFRFTLSPRVHFYGMVGNEKKAQVMQRSKGLVFPVRWHEPFGLAVIESLYYGAPVFATPYGSLPELVQSEVGFLSDNHHTLATHIQHAHYEPKRCHDYVTDLFSAERMATDYLAKYEQVLSGHNLCAQPPHAPTLESALPWA